MSISASLRKASRLGVLSLALASVALASSIDIEPIMVGTGTDRLATDLLFASAIYEQVPLGVVAQPEHAISYYTGTALTQGTDMWATNALDNLDSFLSDASWQYAPEITVWYVDHIYVTGGEARGVTFVDVIGTELRFGVGVSLSEAVPDTLAHELAHMLTWYIYLNPVTHLNTLYFTCADPNVVWGVPSSGCYSGEPDHDANPNNLMAAGSIRNYSTLISQIQGQGGTRDQITPSQADFMLLHTDFLVPEPAAVLLFSSGTAFLWLIRRRRAA